jgi:hypothetical protein
VKKATEVSPIKYEITIIKNCTIIGKNSIFKHDITPYLRIRHGKVNTPVISEFECIELNIIIIAEF